MTRQEFLEKLRLALNGRVEPSVVAENLNYYEDYINTEIRKGKSEEEVMALLGDPRLIARTILETTPGAENGADRREAQARRAGDGWPDGRSEEADSQETEGVGQFWRDLPAHIPGWVWGVVALVIVVLVLSVVFRILAFLAPVLIVMAVVLFLVKVFRDWL